MFTLYCDDSGTHAQSDIAVAGCYVSTVEQWQEFKRNWDDANRRENFGVSHMADFVAKKEQFSSPEWQDDAKRERTIKRLINIIKTRAYIGFAAVVVKSAFDEVIVNGSLREKFGENHYAFAVRLCTALLDKWRQKHGYKQPVRFVFDRLSKGRGDINAIFQTLLLGGEHALSKYGVHEDCWSFESKAHVVQLQAADIWAWENYRYMLDCFIPGKLKGLQPAPPRASYLALIKSPVVVRYHVKHTLEELVRVSSVKGLEA